MPEQAIRHLIRDKIRSGQLPREDPDRIFGGNGSGLICAACDRPIQSNESEIEANCVDGQTRHYHARCHALVSDERAHFDQQH